MRPENLREAKSLVKRYRSLTRERLKEVMDNKIESFVSRYSGKKEFKLKGANELISSKHKGRIIMFYLTGFSVPLYCPLCKAIDKTCEKCVWHYRSNPLWNDDYCVGKNSKDKVRITYKNIERADTIDKLLNALKERADLLEKVIRICEKREYENPFTPQEEGN